MRRSSSRSWRSCRSWPGRCWAGGALAPLRATFGALWEDAAFGLRSLGWDTSGPADPFSAVVAVIGSLWPAAPSRALVVLWVLALPLAALGGWFAATRFSNRPIVRAAVAVAWALAPTLLNALITGRPTVVILHVLLPWLLWTGVVAHRSWSAAGMASIVAVAVVACAPSVAPALTVLWMIAIILTSTRGRGHGLARVVWLAIPTAVVFAPLIWQRLRTGNPWALLADPGVPLADPGAVDVGRRLMLALGFPQADGWASLSGPEIATWTPLLVAPLLVLAIIAPIIGRTLPAAILALSALVGLATAIGAVGIAVTTDAQTVITLWPGAGLSVYWLAITCAAALALDATPSRFRLRTPLAAFMMTALAVSAVPALTASLRGVADIAEGASSTLPAYVEAEGRGGLSTATFVLTPLGSGAVVTNIVWGETASLGGQTTLRSARSAPDAGDETTAALAAQLITDPEGPVVADLAAHGIAFVLLDDSESTSANGIRNQAESSLDQREDLEIVGETARGKLWRVTTTVADRPATPASEVWRVALLQAGVILAALLLALPTRLSRAHVRRRPRVVGLPKPRRAVRTRGAVGDSAPPEPPTPQGGPV